MRIAARTTALAAVAVSIATAVDAQNLLMDGGFEDETAVINVGAGGSTAWGGFGNAFIENDFNQQNPGVDFQALKMFQAFTGSLHAGGGALQSVAVTPGTTLKFSCLLRNGDDLGGDPLTPGNFILAKIEWLDGTGKLMAAYEDRGEMVVDWTDPAGPWKPSEIVDIAPPGAASAQVFFLHFYDPANDPMPGVDDGGASWADDAVLEVTTEVTPESKSTNLLTNGGFDTTTDWTSFGNANRYVNNIDPNGDGDINDGDFGVLVIRGLASASLFQTFPEDPPGTPSNEANTSGWFQDVPVTPGQAYQLTAVGRNGNGFGTDGMEPGNSAVIKIEWLDGSDEIIEGQGVEDPVNGGIDGSTPVFEFQPLSVTGVAPAGAVKARVFVLHIYDGTGTVGNNAGSSWFDDVCFQETTIEIPPVIVGIAKSGNTVTVTFENDGSSTYDLLKSTTLDPGLSSFTDVAGQTGLSGAGATLDAVDSAATEEAAWYAIRRNP